MATVLLIHGSTQNASSWRLVAPYLAKAGHSVITPELPKNEPDWNSGQFVDAILRAVPESDDLSAVVAHSASGIFLPLIASIRPVRLLVYLAAVIPLPGSSVIDQFRSSADMLMPDWADAGGEWRDRRNWRELSDRFLFHDCSDVEREEAHRTVEPMRNDGAMRDPMPALIPLRKGESICVICSLDHTINPAWQDRVWRERFGSEPVILRAGHCPHIAAPDEVAAVILGAIEASRNPSSSP